MASGPRGGGGVHGDFIFRRLKIRPIGPNTAQECVVEHTGDANRVAKNNGSASTPW